MADRRSWASLRNDNKLLLDEVGILRARIAAVEAERDEARWLEQGRAAERDKAVARLAEVEAERDHYSMMVDSQSWDALEYENADLRARLAAVEAEVATWNIALHFYAENVRAAARGEGDRPAEPWPDCPDHREVQHRDGMPPWCNACGWNRGRPAVPPRQVSGEGDRG